ncbi:MAG: hypothetical protein U1E28_17550 [Beijerinckiaceae bacterium]
MNDTNETIRLNLTSRAILAATVALGLGVAFFSAPTPVVAHNRAKLPSIASSRTLSDAPGIALAKAYGREDEDCVAVATGRGATPNRVACAH